MEETQAIPTQNEFEVNQISFKEEKNKADRIIVKAGNIASSYTLTLPESVSSYSQGLIQSDTSGTLSFSNADTFVRTTGDQSISGVKTFNSYLTLNASNDTSVNTFMESKNSSNVYLKLGSAGATTDFAYLRQIGGANDQHITLDLHDDGNSRFSIRNIESYNEGDPASPPEPDVITTNFTIDNSGNVGINTASPTETLHVNGTCKINSSLYVGATGSSGSTIYMSGANALDNGYNFSVIETRTYADPESTEMLLFKGNDIIGEPGPDRVRIRGGAIAFDTYPAASVDRYAENIRMYITSGGNVGIGTTSPNYQLELSADSAAKPNGGFWSSTSDERLKEDIQAANLTICYENIKKLPLRRYKWRSNAYDDAQINSDRRRLGFIAQEYQKVFPKDVKPVHFKKTKQVEVKSGSQLDVKFDVKSDVKSDVKTNTKTIIDYELKDCLTINTDQIIMSMYGAMQKMIKKIEVLENLVIEKGLINRDTLNRLTE
jgi:hypothetical protein